MEEIRFGGSGSLSALSAAAGSGIASLPGNDEEFQRRYADILAARPPWLKALEAGANKLRSTPEGRASYGDPVRGATLPQAWRMQFAISGHFKVCLLARGQPSTPTEGIPEVVLIAPAEITNALARGFAEIEGFTAQVFVHDGRMGHSISLQGLDPATHTFRYHDPWPEKSLLCREFNIAGVDAQPAEGGLWQVTEAELGRVIFAAFVMPTDWAHLTGRAYRIPYSVLKQSDFWKFFHVREVERKQAGERMAVSLQTGGFQQELSLQLRLDRADAVREASLALRRGWMVGPPHGVNPFAADIAKSFLGAFLPEPDQTAGTPYVRAIADLRLVPTVKALSARCGQPNLSAEEELQLTYLGLLPERTVLLTFGRIDARNADRSGEPWLNIGIDLY
jgi:hypothetical protein